ncbi:AAA family ATPase [Nitrospina gracilis]|uniref:AAA family ATPase n=1 Tax=Nitrospina gracilis TaxID=35801 RepID=UPI001F216E43|nr:ATP-binding protein [Nitrospina gracilis]MCF8719249.1 Cdc6-like AAA superfamily ATPase [Nitrospina gracilis Nb-211]
MNNNFVNTRNVAAFYKGLEILKKGVRGRHGILLLRGKPGTGKTFVTQKQAMEDGYTYLRCRFIDSPRILLQNLVAELGEEPKGYTGHLYKQALEQLLARPRTLIFDEADYIVDHKFVEIIRDLNDQANVPVIIAGMELIDKKLQRYPHFFDRIRTIVKFDLFEKSDIESLACRLCETKLDAAAMDYILEQSGGKFRVTMDLFDVAERTAKHSKMKQLSRDQLKQVWEKERQRWK